MGGDSAFMSMLRIAGFLSAAWTATKLSRLIGISSIVLEISTGIILGPEIIGLMPKHYSQCESMKYTDCEAPADFAGGYGTLSDDLKDTKAHGHCDSYYHPSHDLADHHSTDLTPLDNTSVTTTATTTMTMSATALVDNVGARLLLEDSLESLEGDEIWGGLFDEEGAPRRLGGGGNYHDYGECLVGECKANKSSQCQLYPDVFTLVGHTGVAMMIFESGMHFDFAMAKQVGPLACVIAVIGTFLPLLSGMILAWIYGNPISPDGLTAGTALAPTSVGISLRLLGEAGVLNLPFGQTIMTAAFVDDILSLILFNIIFAVAAGEITFVGTFLKSILGIIFMLFAIFLAVFFWPKALKNYILPGAETIKRKLAPVDPDDPPKISEKDEALFFVMLSMLITYGLITYLCGTHLWGCFIAGMSFACLDEEPGHAHHVWVRQTKKITSWMIRIFFSCTVAFAIPVWELLSFQAFWMGSIMGIGPCILTKVSCALFMGQPKFVIGWAMVGRAEFAYLIAQMGKAGGMVSDQLFAQLIWALLWATIFAPLVFRYVLNKYIAEAGIEVASPKKAANGGHGGHGDHGAAKGHANRLMDEEAPREASHVAEETSRQEPKVGAAAPESNVAAQAVVVASESKPWEEEALSKPVEELPPMPTLKGVNPGDPQGRGFLCCIFFKKMTTV